MAKRGKCNAMNFLYTRARGLRSGSIPVFSFEEISTFLKVFRFFCNDRYGQRCRQFLYQCYYYEWEN